MDIKLISLDTVSSTSTHAQALLAEQATELPFAVFAQQQSAGRGRLGKTWVSPSGNLYLTFVFPAASNAADPAAGMTPIKVAVLCCNWLAETLSVNARIKWPNDLLWNGKKLGGILCETSVQGQTMGPLLVGIGINVKEAPQGLDYEAVSLQDIAGGSVSAPQELAESLVRYFAARWQKLDSAGVQRGYENHALGRGTLWVAKPGTGQGPEYFLDDGIGADGSLKLRSLTQQTLKMIDSVHQPLAWYYQCNNQPQRVLLVADVGNSQVKFGYGNVEDAELKTLIAAPTKTELEAALRKLKQFSGMSNWPLYCVSVNEKNFDFLQAACRDAGLVAVKVPNIPVAVKLPHYKIQELGADRLAAMEGFVAKYPHRAGVVVSLGTAVTIDVIRHDGTQLGGWILPGIQTSFSALHEKAGRLPLIRFKDEVMNSHKLTLGHDTHTAMRDGVLMMIRQTVALAVGYLEGADVLVVVCGGDAKAFAQLFPAQIEAQLILIGVKQLVLG